MNEKIIQLDEVGTVKIIRNHKASRVKITIRSAIDIRVTVPWGAPFSTGEKFLQTKKDWVIQTVEKLAKKATISKQVVDGDLFATRNNLYKVAAGSNERLHIKYIEPQKTVLIEYPQHADPATEEMQSQIKFLIEGVLRFEAKRYLPMRTRQLATEMGFQVNRITVKNNKTNWGSCSGLKNINLNLHLMRLPDRLIDFIIIHELVHTKIPNHGPKFQAAMKEHFPDIDQIKKEIKMFRPEVI
jgi:predicted metal-dependent hydrolase